MNGRESEEENLNKSEISQVFEIALKRNLPVNFEVRLFYTQGFVLQDLVRFHPGRTFSLSIIGIVIHMP
jgi:hypothetical protein